MQTHILSRLMRLSSEIQKRKKCSKCNMLMGNDVPEFMGRTNENENRSKIAIMAESKEEVNKLFNELSTGGQIEGPIGDSPWVHTLVVSEIDCII